MAFPRILAIAEIGWSPRPASDTCVRGDGDIAEFFGRVAAVGRHLDALGVTYHRVRGVPWVE